MNKAVKRVEQMTLAGAKERGARARATMARWSAQAAAAAFVLAALPAALQAADPPPVAYPQGWREWTHVKSMVIQPGHALFDAFGGIHHLYANKQALAGYRAGGKFADGSVIVFDLLEAKSADNTVQEGARKVLGVMVKDSRRYAATGGWGYEGFKGDSKTERAVGANAASACHACHQARKDNDHVFSAWRP
ncbi:MAG: cytochrome P460 family protein [Rubrivivax sp.]|nr:cytochrome P460 family protein [Rubrivivax sp.]